MGQCEHAPQTTIIDVGWVCVCMHAFNRCQEEAVLFSGSRQELISGKRSLIKPALSYTRFVQRYITITRIDTGFSEALNLSGEKGKGDDNIGSNCCSYLNEEFDEMVPRMKVLPLILVKETCTVLFPFTVRYKCIS